AAITDQKTSQVLPQLGSVALQSGEHAGETIARLVAEKKTKPFAYRDKGTMATIGRGAAVVQMLGGKTMKGLKAQVAWGTVHLALLPTNEDRAKAVVDWAGAGFTHQRVGRITVHTDERDTGQAQGRALRRAIRDQLRVTASRGSRGRRRYSAVLGSRARAPRRLRGRRAVLLGTWPAPDPVAEPHRGRTVRVRRAQPPAPAH